MFSRILEIFLDAFLDSLKVLPILYVVYLLVEYLLHKKREKFLKTVSKQNGTSVLIGAGLGIIPQCGFGTIMADFYSKKYISLGTLFAIFLATSDEAIIVMFSNYTLIPDLLLLIACKIVIAIVAGYFIDYVLKRKLKNKIAQSEIDEAVKHNRNAECDHEHMVEHEHHKEHKSDEECECCTSHIFLHALKHTLEILIFVFLANLFIGAIIEFTGFEQVVNSILVKGTPLEPLICTLIGVIPNCFPSVFLVQMYANGYISFFSLLGGLSAGAGVGILVLFKQNKNIKQNILIMCSLICIGFCIGLIGLLF